MLAGPYDVVGVFYDKEEGPVEENQLRTILDAVPWLTDAEFAVVLEPTDLRLEMGCNGAMNISVRFQADQHTAPDPGWVKMPSPRRRRCCSSF